MANKRGTKNGKEEYGFLWIMLIVSFLFIYICISDPC